MNTPPDFLVPYLYAKGSLTACLEQRARQPLCVKILYEGYQPLDLSCKKTLKLTPNRPTLAWVREVLLYGNTPNAWVKAKSVFALPYLAGDGKRLRHLHHTPIGYVLFKKNRHLPHTRHYYEHSGQFGRQTVYDWHGRKLIIDELFLAEFMDVLKKS